MNNFLSLRYLLLTAVVMVLSLAKFGTIPDSLEAGPTVQETESLQEEVQRLENLSQEELQEEFDRHMGEWRHNFALLAQAHSAFYNSKKQEADSWAVQFRRARREGDEARKNAGLVAVHLAARNVGELDSDVISMTVHSMEEYVAFEKYHLAYKAGKALVDAGVDDPSVLALAGYTAYCNNHIKEARDLFSEAVVRGYKLPEPYEKVNLQLDRLIEMREKEAQLDAASSDLPIAEIKTTAGTLVVELYEDQAPNAVANFVALAERDFFEGLEFYNTTRSYVTTGSPTNDATGNAGYSIKSEYDRDDRRLHMRGSLSLMVIESMGTGSSQFSILTQPLDEYNGSKNTVFGRIIEGDIVLDDIARIGEEWKEMAKTGNLQLEDPDRILSITIRNKRDHDYIPKTLAIR